MPYHFGWLHLRMYRPSVRSQADAKSDLDPAIFLDEKQKAIQLDIPGAAPTIASLSTGMTSIEITNFKKKKWVTALFLKLELTVPLFPCEPMNVNAPSPEQSLFQPSFHHHHQQLAALRPIRRNQQEPSGTRADGSSKQAMDSQPDGWHQKGLRHRLFRRNLSLHPHLPHRKEQTSRPSHFPRGRNRTQECRRTGTTLSLHTPTNFFSAA